MINHLNPAHSDEKITNGCLLCFKKHLITIRNDSTHTNIEARDASPTHAVIINAVM